MKSFSFIRMNSNERIPTEVNGSISQLNRNRDNLSKSNYNLDLSDINFLNSNKKDFKYKKLSLNNLRDKLFEPYSGRTNNPSKHYQNNNYLLRSTNLKETLKSDNDLYYFPTLEEEKEKEKKIDKSILNSSNKKDNIKDKNLSNKNLINLNHKISKAGQNEKTTIKPYSKKVIPKAEKKSKFNKIGQNIRECMDKNINFQFTNIDINKSLNANEISYKLKNYNDFDFRNSSINKYKKNLLENNLDTSIDDKEKEKYSNNRNSNYHKFNLNLSKKKNLYNNSKNHFPKFRDIPLLKSDYKKLSVSVNKIKVNGVSNKNKYNRKLIFGMQKTPMKTETNLKNP